MSYILEALKKSERERQLGQTPALPSLLTEQPPKRPHWLPWLVLGLLSSNGAALYFGFTAWDKNRAEPRPATATRLHPGTTDENPRVEADGKPPMPIPRAPRPAPLGSAVAKTDAAPTPAAEKAAPVRLPPASEGSVATPSASNTTVGTSKPAPIEKSASDRAAAAAVAPRAMSDQPLPPAYRQEPAAPPLEVPTVDRAAGSKPEPLPVLSAMPVALQQRVPAMKVNVLAYSSRPEERFAVIDMVRYARGDRLPSGAVLVDVQADGLVLQLEGSTFRVPHR